MDNKIVTYADLKRCLTAEILKNRKKFSWTKILWRCFNEHQKRYIFWWRVANYFFHKRGKFNIKLGKRINRSLMKKYNTEIQLDAIIGEGLYIGHYGGIVVSGYSIIGKNFTIRQNTTIGIKKTSTKKIIIGDNVDVGANSCIISDGLIIGDNVIIGAMSFINKNIPPNTTVYTEKTNKLTATPLN